MRTKYMGKYFIKWDDFNVYPSVILTGIMKVLPNIPQIKKKEQVWYQAHLLKNYVYRPCNFSVQKKHSLLSESSQQPSA